MEPRPPNAAEMSRVMKYCYDDICAQLDLGFFVGMSVPLGGTTIVVTVPEEEAKTMFPRTVDVLMDGETLRITLTARVGRIVAL